MPAWLRRWFCKRPTPVILLPRLGRGIRYSSLTGWEYCRDDGMWLPMDDE